MGHAEVTDVLRRAELAYEKGQFRTVIGLLHQASVQADVIPASDAYRYHRLRAFLAERAGNWGGAVQSWLSFFHDFFHDEFEEGAHDRRDGDDPCGNWCDGCDCDVRGVLDGRVGVRDAVVCECCPAHVLWALAWRAAGHGELQAVLDAVPDLTGHRRTAVVHALALGALRTLTDAGAASPLHIGLAIGLWRVLLDADDPLGFRAMITARRGAPVTDELWLSACDDLAQRVRGTLRAVDAHEGRDALDSWETAWQVEQEKRHAGVGVAHCVSPGAAAEFLVRTGRPLPLLDAYTLRHPDPRTWTAQSPSHHGCAPYVGQALIHRAHEHSARGERDDALADFTTAVRLGVELDDRDRAEVRSAGLKAGQNRNGYFSKATLVPRIHWLGSALALAPGDRELTGELVSVLVRQGTRATPGNRTEARQRFTRALELRPGHDGAQDGLDALLLADVKDVLQGRAPDRTPRVKQVEGLLRRRFDRGSGALADAWLPALRWFDERMTEGAVDDVLKGKTDTARRKVKRLRAVTLNADPLSARGTDAQLAGLLRAWAYDCLAHRPPGYAQDVRTSLITAAELEGLHRSTGERHLVKAVYPLAAELVDEGRGDELIALYVNAALSPGLNAALDQLVATAYGRRAKERRAHGDLGGAIRDERTAAAFRLRPSWQDSLFEDLFDLDLSAPPESDGGATPSQETL